MYLADITSVLSNKWKMYHKILLADWGPVPPLWSSWPTWWIINELSYCVLQNCLLRKCLSIFVSHICFLFCFVFFSIFWNVHACLCDEVVHWCVSFALELNDDSLNKISYILFISLKNCGPKLYFLHVLKLRVESWNG